MKEEFKLAKRKHRLIVNAIQHIYPPVIKGRDLCSAEGLRLIKKRTKADTNYMRNLHNPRRKKMWSKLIGKYTRKIDRYLFGMERDRCCVWLRNVSTNPYFAKVDIGGDKNANDR